MGSDSGAGAQPPEQDRPRGPDWRPGDDLTALEEEMRAKAETGEVTDGGEGPFDLSDMLAWGAERTVRAAVLQYLLIEKEWPVATKGIQMKGVRIGGHLDLEAATLHCPLFLDSCYFDIDTPAVIDYATASTVTLVRCRLAGLSAKGLSARNLDLSGSTITAPALSLSAAWSLWCSRSACTARQVAAVSPQGLSRLTAKRRRGAGLEGCPGRHEPSQIGVRCGPARCCRHDTGVLGRTFHTIGSSSGNTHDHGRRG